MSSARRRSEREGLRSGHLLVRHWSGFGVLGVADDELDDGRVGV